MAKRAGGLTWRNPGPTSNARSGTDHAIVAVELRKNPGQWAEITIYPSRSSAQTMASFIRTGRKLAYAPGGTFESTTRMVDDGYALYARYVGEEQEYA